MENTSVESNPFIQNNASTASQKTASDLNNIWQMIKKLVLPYWRSAEKRSALTLLSVVIALNLFYVYISVLMNRWNGNFFDALQKLDKSQYSFLLMQFGFYIFIITTFLSKEYLQNYLSFRWRSWMTKNYLTQWFANKAFYQSLYPEQKIDNPDQRISQDINDFCFTSFSIVMSTVNNVVSAVSFGIILWSLSPVLSFSLGSFGNAHIAGYMLWAALFYALINSFIMFKIGRPLVKLDFIQEKTEANFRFGLMRIVERKEEVALINGEKDDFHFLKANFEAIRENYKQILIRRIYISGFQNAILNATTVFPLIVAAPMFFSGAITLGIVMQLSGAFSVTTQSLMFFVTNYQEFAGWKATANRLDQFQAHTQVEMPRTPAKITFQSDTLTVHDLHVYKSKTDLLFKVAFSLVPGEKVLLQGPSGIGKTTLVRTLAGIWPFAKGKIIKPTTLEIVPQKPYFPIAKLREVILYGNPDKTLVEGVICQQLEAFGLPHLINHLEEIADWNAKLSLGEQQRLNFVRIALINPTWLILDEPTASLDKANQQNSIRKIFTTLKESTILTISHSQELETLHDRIIKI